MRSTILKTVVLLFAILHGNAFSQGNQESSDLFNRANQKYKNGHFQKALNLYEQIPNKSAGVNYNIGNCAYKLKQFGQALVHWPQATHEIIIWFIFVR